MFFTPLESSPPSIEDKFRNKVSKLVVEILGEEEIKRLYKERQDKVYSSIASAVKKLKTEEK